VEDEAEGRKHITPFWRTLKFQGELNPKYPAGIQGKQGDSELKVTESSQGESALLSRMLRNFSFSYDSLSDRWEQPADLRKKGTGVRSGVRQMRN
jgi:hypothetical protein